MASTRVVSRYAKSLLELAIEEGTLEQVLSDVNFIRKAMDNRELYLLLKSPIIKSGTKSKVLSKVFGKNTGKLTLAFIDILVRKGRENFLPEIVGEFDSQYKEYMGITTVVLRTASPLPEKLISQIKMKLEESDDTREQVDLRVETEPDLIGGFVLEFEDKLMDSSITHMIKQMKKEYQFEL